MLSAFGPLQTPRNLAEALRISRDPALYASLRAVSREKGPSLVQRVRNLPVFGNAFRNPPPDPFEEAPLPSVEPPVYAPVLPDKQPALAEALIFWGQSTCFKNPYFSEGNPPQASKLS